MNCHLKLSINDTQKHLIKATLVYFFDDLQTAESAQALDAIRMIKKEGSLTTQEQTSLRNVNLLDTVEFVRKILNHPYPQNRTMGEHIQEGIVYYLKDEKTMLYEPEGLLNLSPKNGETTQITKAAVVNYIHELLEHLENLIRDKTKKIEGESPITSF